MRISRKRFVKAALLLPAILKSPFSYFIKDGNPSGYKGPFKRVRPGDADWPQDTAWENLSQEVNGKLLKLNTPFTADNAELFKNLKNPYFIGDNPVLTQTSGWVDAWRSEPSVYAVAAKTTADIVAAVNFARNNHLRLVVKGGGHSYQGNSNASDSLLIWTRAMNNIIIHDAFIPEDSPTGQSSQPAVTIEAGAMWGPVYDAVTTKQGRYVQGGGCLTVGVAGLIQGGGFGSFSKFYGLAAAVLLEAEIVTADGSVKIVNAFRNTDLFWALKGGGGGSFGVVTKMTLMTRDLPEYFGTVFGIIKAHSTDAYKRLIEKIMILYKDQLFNPIWGEQIIFRTDLSIRISMLFHGLTKVQAQSSWQDFIDWINTHPSDYEFEQPLNFITLSARHLWDPTFLKKFASSMIGTDDRPGVPDGNIYWMANKGEAGQFINGYHSAWLPQNLLEKDNIPKLAEALFESSRHWTVSLHFNKGLAGAKTEELAMAKNTSINPALLDAFALVIIAGEADPAFTGVPGYEPNLTEARDEAAAIGQAMLDLKKILPTTGSYVSETDYFEENWQQSFWGSNYKKLLSIKNKYDPDGLFFVHHGVGSEGWSSDGFTRL